jgi:hypothetical protein
LTRFQFKSGIVSFYFSFIFVSFGESCLLVSWCAVCEWFDLKTTRTVCEWFYLKTTRTVCEWFYLKTTWTVSSGLASKPAATVFAGLASKPVATVFSSLTSKLVATISPGLASKPAVGFLVEPQNRQLWFDDLCLKITAAVS